MSTIAWVLVVVFVAVVVYLVTFGKKKLERCADYCVDVHYTEVFIKAVGGQWAYDRLEFIFPETLEGLICEYGEMREQRQRTHDEFDQREKQLHVEWIEKSRQVPKADGTLETEIQRRAAQKIADRAYEAVQDVRRQWEYWSRNRTPVDVLVRRAQAREQVRVVNEGAAVCSERETEADGLRVLRRIYRLSDDRYFLVGFRVGYGQRGEVRVEDISYCTNSPGQFSEEELRVVIADKAARAQQTVAQS